MNAGAGRDEILNAPKRQPKIEKPVEPDGDVVQGAVDTLFEGEGKKRSWTARIELHPHEGVWMWGTGYQIPDNGAGYRVGAKWGNFAHSKSDALFYAVEELAGRLSKSGKPEARKVIEWAEGLAV